LKKVVLKLRKEEKYMKIKPLYDRVLIRRLEGSTTSKGGIIIPDSAKEKPLEGEVIAVGSGRLLKDGSTRPLTVKEGDKVLFAKYAETEVKINNETLLLLREEDLLGIIA
jgi:chaperonin GroES